MRLLYLSFFLFIIAYSANAQRKSYGIQFDAGVSTISNLDKKVPQVGLPDSPKYKIRDFSSSPSLAIEFGASYQYEYRNRSFIQAAILMDLFKGEKIHGVSKGNGDITALNVSSFSFEGYFGKKYYTKKGHAFLLAGGAKLSLNYSGGYGGSSDVRYYDECYYDPSSRESYCEEVTYFTSGDSFGVNTLGVSVGGLVGYQFGSYQLGVSYMKGMNSLFKDDKFNSKLDMLKLSFIYYFYM